MKKIITIISVLTVFLLQSVTVFAQNAEIKDLGVTVEQNKVTVTGSADQTGDLLVAAVMVGLYKGDTNLAMESFEVNSDNSFTGTIEDLSLEKGETYTVKVADYDGGTWETIEGVCSQNGSAAPEDEVSAVATSSEKASEATVTGNKSEKAINVKAAGNASDTKTTGSVTVTSENAKEGVAASGIGLSETTVETLNSDTAAVNDPAYTGTKEASTAATDEVTMTVTKKEKTVYSIAILFVSGALTAFAVYFSKFAGK
ncbi:MAG: hypothetical protein K6F84_05380 [Lachnospiraceae bacterium]|nr:hypothetical protein [Lachnospiraceae bacterium]